MKRKINNQISEAIPILHKILLMVENDEVSFAYGCNWSSVKQNATTVNINNKDNQVIIESSNGEILKMKKGGTLPNFRGKAKRMSNKTEMITVI